MVPGEPPAAGRQCGGWALCDCCCWLLLPALLLLLLLARPDKLAAFPTSLSDCQTPTGWNCSGTRRPPAPGEPPALLCHPLPSLSHRRVCEMGCASPPWLGARSAAAPRNGGESRKCWVGA